MKHLLEVRNLGLISGKGKTGRGSLEKTIVVVATECHGKQIGRVLFECIESATSENLMNFIENNIEHGSTMYN